MAFSRRDFLKHLGIGAGFAAAGVALPNAIAQIEPAIEAIEEPGMIGYSEALPYSWTVTTTDSTGWTIPDSSVIWYGETEVSSTNP